MSIGISESAESIRPENIIKVIFLNHQSKLCLRVYDYYGYWNSIYFNKDDQTLEVSDAVETLYYLDIELDSEINELLETTQFKIRVSE